MSAFSGGARTRVQCVQGGPLILRGDITLIAEDGSEIATSRLTSLCRCGRSATPPLCDGSHAKKPE